MGQITDQPGRLDIPALGDGGLGAFYSAALIGISAGYARPVNRRINQHDLYRPIVQYLIVRKIVGAFFLFKCFFQFFLEDFVVHKPSFKKSTP